MSIRRCALPLLLIAVSTLPKVIAASAAQGGDPPSQTSGAQEPSASPTAKPDAEKAVTDKPDYSKESFVTEYMRSLYRFENDGTGRRETVYRIHVQSEAGVQRWGQLRFAYNSANERIEIPYVRVLKQDGSVVSAGPEAVQDLSGAVQQVAPVYTDYREKHVTVPGLRPGDVLEFQSVTVVHTALAPGQFWTQYDFDQTNILLEERLEIDIPAGRTVKLKTKPGTDPVITEPNGRRIYRWTSSHLVREEDSKDKDKDKDKDKEKEKAKKKKQRKADEPPAIQLTTFGSWEEVGRWYAALEKDRRMPSKEVQGKADALTKGLTSDLDRTQALYDFVAQNFRYVSLSLGQARYQPHLAADVLHDQYGDCKDKHTLLESLLEAEGMHASSVLINSRRKLDPDVPSPSQFDHVITLLPLGKEEIWMDTTTEVAPFRLLAFPLRKKQALVVPEDGVPHLEETPADPPVSDSEVAEIVGKVSESGKLEAKVSYTDRGDNELILRMAFRRFPSTQWQRFVEGLNQTLGGEVSNVKVSDLTATREPFTLSYEVSKANFVDWSKKKLELKLPLSLFNPASIGADVGEDRDDPDAGSPEPFKLGPPNEQTYNIKLELAARYTAQVPVPMTLERDYGAYHSTYLLKDNIFTAERKLSIRQSELPPARADDYRAFRRGVLADAAQHLTLESAVADIHAVPSGMKAADFIRSGNEARRNGNYVLAVDLLNRAVEADPRNKSAWNDLGLAYFEMRQDGLAINAFQKQVEINPYHEYSYNNLGRVYLRQRKYDEAEKWFHKQIEVDPLDKYAHENLGIADVEQHKYEDAIPELEKAATLTPGSTGPETRLGEAYLNLGQDEKAMAAFDRALKISATPGVWNTIAYRLALKGTHLDRARSYAESAVSATAAGLRNISLDQLDRRRLELSSSLARYWDTMGWVEFADGNLDKAQKYVWAAWQLYQGADATDHLGQIYEKKNDKQQAIHFYALAISARRPEPETRGRLAALLGGDDKVDAVVEKYRDELQQQRSVKLPNTSKQEGKADFFLLLSVAPGSDATVEAARFVSGDEKLKGLADALHSAKYHQTFPDETPVKILRRGTVTCTAASSECTMLFALPEDVSSVD
jgi:tetratricopeptide (TPR) repeat protein